jgi:restriction system protein
MTIKDAIEVMPIKVRPMPAIEAYDAIIAAGLYETKAAIPSSIVRGEIRRYCVGFKGHHTE